MKAIVWVLSQASGDALNVLPGLEVPSDWWADRLRRFLKTYYDPDFGSEEQCQKIVTDLTFDGEGFMNLPGYGGKCWLKYFDTSGI